MKDGVAEAEVSLFNSSQVNSIVAHSEYQRYGKSNYFRSSNEAYGSLIGFIKGQPEGGDEVVIRNKYNTHITATNENGSFSFHNVICGNYYITLESSTSERKNNSMLERVSVPCESVAIHTITTVFDEHCNTGEKTPILLVPGILGSTSSHTLGIYPDLPARRPLWSEGKIKMHNIFLGNEAYKIFDYIGWERIKSELQEAGYTENCTLFTVPYYWPDKASDNVKNYLIKMIQHAKFVSGSPKVNIIAHSMGGLVVREYLQSDNYNNDVDKVAMVGTPQQGSVLAYYIWEHGNTIQADGGYTTALSFLSPAHFFYTYSLQKYFQEIKGFSPCVNHNVLVTTNIWKLPVYCDSRVIKDFVRSYVPSLKELLPVYHNSLKSENGNSISSSNMWLKELNQSLLERYTDINIMSYIGSDIPTNKTLILNQNGHILDTLITQKGDGTVVSKSSTIEHFTTSMKKGSHGKLPNVFLDEIVDFIDVPKIQILSDE